MDGSKLNNILQCCFDTNLGIDDKDVDSFIECCLYVGKGKNDRKIQHAKTSKRILDKQLLLDNNCAKLNKITELCEQNQGITVLQLFNDANHYEAHRIE
jgi:hypothetical protein